MKLVKNSGNLDNVKKIAESLKDQLPDNAFVLLVDLPGDELSISGKATPVDRIELIINALACQIYDDVKEGHIDFNSAILMVNRISGDILKKIIEG